MLPAALLVGFALLVAAPLSGLFGSLFVTLDAFLTREYLLTTLTYCGAAVLVVLTVRTRQRMFWLLGAIVASGLLQAFTAVVLRAAGETYVYLFMPFERGSRATGSFPNPDHLAGYLELCLSAGLGLLFAQWATGEAQQAEGWRGSLVTTLSFVMSTKMLLRLLLVVMVIAMVMTRSRMGNAAFFLALGMMGAVLAIASRQLRRPALWLVASMAIVDLVVIGQWVGLDHLVQRMEQTSVTNQEAAAAMLGQPDAVPQEESLEQRMVVPKMSLAVVRERPWFGHGGGTYAMAFPPLKQASGGPGLLMYWDHAHNDYVQVACDTGWVGLALWVGIGLSCAVRAVQLVRDDRNRVNQGVGVAALMAVFAMGWHGMVDFNLHVPANALTFTVLLAAVWALPSTGGRSGRRRSRATEAD